MNESVKLFDETGGLALAAQNDAAAVARAVQEIQAALVIAQRFKRDEVACKSRIIEACKRKDLAEVAEYEYSRGGTRITGPTIDLLRAVANRWGNIRHGWTETERAGGVSSIRCFAWDLQTNAQAERTFKVRHWRDTRDGGYEIKEERDIYELMANQAARRVRACLEEVIDSDVVTAAVDQCRTTLRTGEQTPLKDRAVQIVGAFQEFGVTQAMIEARLGNKMEAVSENQIASLRRVFKSLKDGVGQRDDYFKPEMAKPDFTPQATYNPGTASTPVTPAKSEPKGHALIGIRAALKARKITEGQLMDFWGQTGATDGTFGSLEEVAVALPQLLEHTVANWKEFAEKLQECVQEQKTNKELHDKLQEQKGKK